MEDMVEACTINGMDMEEKAIRRTKGKGYLFS